MQFMKAWQEERRTMEKIQANFRVDTELLEQLKAVDPDKTMSLKFVDAITLYVDINTAIRGNPAPIKLTESQKQKIQKARNAYTRQWKLKNPEKVKQQQDRYWLRKAGEL